MPELPEVESVVRALRSCVSGRVIAGVIFNFTRMLQGIEAAEFTSLLSGREIEQVNRRGKYILFALSGELTLEVHLRMTGRFLFCAENMPVGAYTGAVIYFQGGGSLHYEDIRKFGTFRLWENNMLCHSPAYRLGPDPLDRSFTLSHFNRLLQRKRSVKIKSLLLNQQNLAGLGNIYTDEALHRARIHPARTAGDLRPAEMKRLYAAIADVLQDSIGRGGTTFSDFRDLQGEAGNFQDHLKVYRREKEKCRYCGSLIMRIVLAGRGTYYCPACQAP